MGFLYISFRIPPKFIKREALNSLNAFTSVFRVYEAILYVIHSIIREEDSYSY